MTPSPTPWCTNYPVNLVNPVYLTKAFSLHSTPRVVLSIENYKKEELIMGTKGRPRPENLRHKLRQIRIDLGLSQSEMIRHLGFEDSMHVGRISEYEQGSREPSLLVLLGYAHAARVHLEELVDDDLDLPARLPGSVPYRRYPESRCG